MDPRSVEPSPSSVLLETVIAVHGDWLRGRIVSVVRTAGRDLDARTLARVDDVVTRARAWVEIELGRLLDTDVDDQRANPLHVLRGASRFATELLESAGVPRPRRDEFETRAMPEDPYGIGPLAWRDLGEDVHEAGIVWGAWKAATVLARRSAEGRR